MITGGESGIGHRRCDPAWVRDVRDRCVAAGIAYLLILASLMSVATAMYLKVFHRVTWVTVEAERAGMQLPKFGDVRMHGVIVGQVREISQKDGKAVIKLGLEPEAAKAIPTNSRIQIRPSRANLS